MQLRSLWLVAFAFIQDSGKQPGYLVTESIIPAVKLFSLTLALPVTLQHKKVVELWISATIARKLNTGSGWHFPGHPKAQGN